MKEVLLTGRRTPGEVALVFPVFIKASPQGIAIGDWDSFSPTHPWQFPFKPSPLVFFLLVFIKASPLGIAMGRKEFQSPPPPMYATTSVLFHQWVEAVTRATAGGDTKRKIPGVLLANKVGMETNNGRHSGFVCRRPIFRRGGRSRPKWGRIWLPS